MAMSGWVQQGWLAVQRHDAEKETVQGGACTVRLGPMGIRMKRSRTSEYGVDGVVVGQKAEVEWEGDGGSDQDRI